MLLTFFGQYIFNKDEVAVGLEVLLRGDKDNSCEVDKTPYQIFLKNSFETTHYYALDMQIISFLNSFAKNLKKIKGLKYIFVNFSDSILKEMVMGDENTIPFSSITEIARRIAPLKLVIEVNEMSKIKQDHLSLIVLYLQAKGVLFAQDDFNELRKEHLKINWNFIKINHDEFDSNKKELLGRKVKIILERCGYDDVNSKHVDFHQGFELHYPESIRTLIRKSKKANKIQRALNKKQGKNSSL